MVDDHLPDALALSALLVSTWGSLNKLVATAVFVNDFSTHDYRSNSEDLGCSFDGDSSECVV